jgi:protein arginine kinase activator
MQCEICQNKEATIHLTEITEGVRTEMHLCEQCAQEQGIGSKNYIPLNELLSNLLSVGPKGEEPPATGAAEAACPECGYTLSMFQEKALLGCPHDYEVFKQQLLPLIKKAHDGATRHCGKVPAKIPMDSKKQMEIARLKQQLDEAVKKEDYELAVRLRDKLAEFK